MSKVKICIFSKKSLEFSCTQVCKIVKINYFVILHVPDSIVHEMSGVQKITKNFALHEKTVSMVTAVFIKLANLH